MNADADSRWGDAVNESVHILILSAGSMWHSKTRKIFRNNGDVVYLDWSQGYRFSLETARSFIEVGSQMACTSMSPGHAFRVLGLGSCSLSMAGFKCRSSWKIGANSMHGKRMALPSKLSTVLITQYILIWHLLVLQRSSFKGIKVFRTVSPVHWLVSW